jgi:hypothetical protein
VAARYLLNRRQSARHPRRMPRCGLGEDILHINAEVNRMSGQRTIRYSSNSFRPKQAIVVDPSRVENQHLPGKP